MASIGIYTYNGIVVRYADNASIPPDPRNTDYQKILEAIANGDTIDPYVPPVPSTDPKDYPLTDMQLRLGLLASGLSLETIEAKIKSIPDPVQRQTFWTYWDRSATVKWDDTITQQLIAFVGINITDAATMWLKAKDIVTA